MRMKPRRLPRKYRRPVSKKTKSLLRKRTKHRARWKSERFKRWLRRLQRTVNDWRKFVMRWLLIGVLCTLIFIAGVLLFSPIIQVRQIHVSRTDVRLDREEVQRILSPLFGRHLLLLSEFEVTSLLRENMPDITSVDVRKEYPSDLHVDIELDPVVARLEIVEPDQQPGSQTGAVVDFVTGNGVYVRTSTSLDDTDDLPLISVVDWGARPAPGNIVFTAELLQRMNTAETLLLRQFGQETVARKAYVRAREFHLTVADGYDLWFDMRSDVDTQLNRYRTFLESVGNEAVNEYIDLRIVDRVMYK